MDAYKAIFGRRSIRSFDSARDVGRDDVLELLNAGCQAPSAGNLQPWRFWVIKSAPMREELASEALRQSFVAQAPVVIAVGADIELAGKHYGSRGRDLYCLQDTAAAIENILVAAWARGIGSCWVGAFDESAVKRILELPKNIRPVALIALGYPDNDFKKPARLGLHDLVKFV